MSSKRIVPRRKYGVRYEKVNKGKSDEVLEEISRLGYSKIDAGFSRQKIESIQDDFDALYNEYVEKWGGEKLKNIDEYNTIRAPLLSEYEGFLDIAVNPGVLDIISRVIEGDYILNQQNGIINPPGEVYNQAAWHRDIPYQDYISNTPLAINALYCVDDFTRENGSTFVIPSSHKETDFPSANYIDSHAVQVSAKAGEYILLDCMVFHAGGSNQSKLPRRAVNNVYTIPYFKQQINLPKSLSSRQLKEEHRKLFGFSFEVPNGIDSYLGNR